MKINPFAYHLWQRFWAIASPYWRGDERLRAWGLLALLVVLLLGQTRFAVMLNEQTGEFTSALAARDETRFWDSIQFCVVLLLLAVPIFAFYFVLLTLVIIALFGAINRRLCRHLAPGAAARSRPRQPLAR